MADAATCGFLDIAHLILQNNGIVHGVHGLQRLSHERLRLPSLKLAQCFQCSLKLVSANHAKNVLCIAGTTKKPLCKPHLAEKPCVNLGRELTGKGSAYAAV